MGSSEGRDGIPAGAGAGAEAVRGGSVAIRSLIRRVACLRLWASRRRVSSDDSGLELASWNRRPRSSARSDPRSVGSRGAGGSCRRLPKGRGAFTRWSAVGALDGGAGSIPSCGWGQAVDPGSLRREATAFRSISALDCCWVGCGGDMSILAPSPASVFDVARREAKAPDRSSPVSAVRRWAGVTTRTDVGGALALGSATRRPSDGGFMATAPMVGDDGAVDQIGAGGDATPSTPLTLGATTSSAASGVMGIEPAPSRRRSAPGTAASGPRRRVRSASTNPHRRPAPARRVPSAPPAR